MLTLFLLLDAEPRNETSPEKRATEANPGCGTKNWYRWSWAFCTPGPKGNTGTVDLSKLEWEKGDPWCYIDGDGPFLSMPLLCEDNEGWQDQARNKVCLSADYDYGGCWATD